MVRSGFDLDLLKAKKGLRMKIFIFADMEGCSGISGSEFISGKYQDLGGKLMAADINACVAGCFEAGAKQVIVRDGHGAGTNFNPEEIDPRAELIQGATPGVRYPEIEGAAGLILLGYHAMAGTEGAVLEHTYSSKTVQNMWLNGRKVGEIGIDAAIAAERNVPVLLVTGDDKACQEAVSWIPGVLACQVKRGYCTQGAKLIAPATAREMIRQRTVEAVKRRKKAKLLKLDYPATLRVELIERQMLPTADHCVWIDGRTYERTGDSVEVLKLR
jgi:D-amino peptidase